MVLTAPAAFCSVIMKRQSFLIALMLALLSSSITEAAHSRRPVVRQQQASHEKYDRAITTFSADGRLQQVEYGMEAANRGDSVVAAIVNSTMAIIAVRGRDDKIHRIDAHILLATAGLAGDGRALAASLRSSCQQHFLSYGEAPTVHEVARMAASVQHGLTKTAGARPLGCTAIVVGVVKNTKENNTGEVQVYHTDPGGVLEQCIYCVAGKRKTKILEGLADSFRDSATDDEGFAFDIASKTLTLLKEEGDDASSAKSDLWIVRVVPGKKGNMRLVCAKDIEEESLAARLSFLQ